MTVCSLRIDIFGQAASRVLLAADFHSGADMCEVYVDACSTPEGAGGKPPRKKLYCA